MIRHVGSGSDVMVVCGVAGGSGGRRVGFVTHEKGTVALFDLIKICRLGS